MSSSPKRRKIGSRACDACKVRKVRCTEAPPCDRCVAIGVTCTFNKTQAIRGPRSLRQKTLREIERIQGQDGEALPRQIYRKAPSEDAANRSSGSSTPGDASTDSSNGLPVPIAGPPRVPVAALVLRLCIYRLRLFPVWPILAVEEVIASLQRDARDVETYALANAVGAAAMAQLKLDSSRNPEISDSITGKAMEAECQRVRTTLEGGTASLNGLRTSFFLHIFHENQVPGGTKSLLYLREAITLAQIMGLHRMSTYHALPPAEQQARRRILWLLFVTERGVAMLHKLPVVLNAKTSSRFPSLDDIDAEDEAHILPSFRKLVYLFWLFDQSGAFEIIQNSDDTIAEYGATNAADSQQVLDILQKRLQEVPLDLDEQGSNDVQKADICVTRPWMQVLLWRAALTQNGRASQSDSSLTHAIAQPIQIAKEFLRTISKLPSAALEAHGPTIEFKVYEIASAVTDAIASHLRLPRTAIELEVHQPSDVLLSLQKLLASCRGGNPALLSQLCARIVDLGTHPLAQAGGVGSVLFGFGPLTELSWQPLGILSQLGVWDGTPDELQLPEEPALDMLDIEGWISGIAGNPRMR